MNKKIFTLIVTIATLVILGLGMVSCGSGTAVLETPTGAAVLETPTEAALVETPTEAATGEILEGRILRVASVPFESTNNLDPTLNSSPGAQKMLGGVFEEALAIDVDGNLVPALATSWEFNEDGTIWTIHVREGVQFHDGWGEMTAEDMKFSLERFLRPEAISSRIEELRAVYGEAVVVDKYTLEIHLIKPYPLFVEYFLRPSASNSEGMVMSKAYWEAVGDEGFLTHPIGTGRWMFVEYTPGDMIVFDAFDEHWSGKVPAFDRLIMMEIPEESTRIAMLKRGDADLIDLENLDNAIGLKNEGYTTMPVKQVGITSIRFFDNWRPEAIAANMPTSHEEVRQALTLAINLNEINDTMFSGMFETVCAPGGYTGSSGVDLDAAKWIEWAKKNMVYDPERARELLKIAGFPEGFEISVYSFAGTTDPWQPQLWEVIAGYWEAIGVKTNIIAVDYNGVLRPMLRTIPHPVDLIGTAGIYTVGYQTFPVPRLGETTGPTSSLQLFDPNNGFVMGLAEKVSTEVDTELRKQYFDELLTITANEYVIPTLFYVSKTFAISDKVAEWGSLPSIAYPSLWSYLFVPAE